MLGNNFNIGSSIFLLFIVCSQSFDQRDMTHQGLLIHYRSQGYPFAYISQ